ncbi:MAG: hypothetical protein DRG83_07910 [Deltaproteobacteria bacterium]|nr:MAG: hypothetical protein DRG83_07910 [Deltaproteobacteria bacterium]
MGIVAGNVAGERPLDEAKNVTERELFRVSTQLFKEKGYRGTSMRDISAALVIKTSSIYHYINSKEELLKKIALKGMNMLLDAGKRISAEQISPAEKLQKLVESHTKLICENLDLFTVTLRELTPSNAASFWEEIVDHRDQYEKIVRGIISEGKKLGAFREIDERMAGFALLGMINWIIRWYNPGGSKSPAEIAALWFEIFIGGIKRAPADK